MMEGDIVNMTHNFILQEIFEKGRIDWENLRLT
jgi:hypothetical protein